MTIWEVVEPCCILGLQNKLKEEYVNKKDIVTLAAEERVSLHQMIAAGKVHAMRNEIGR